VTALVREDRFDYVLIEGTGIAEPLPVAETFTMRGAALGGALSSVARLDTMVTVVDASAWLTDVGSVERLTDRPLGAPVGDGRSLATLLVEQVEFADVLVLNKCDLVSPEQRAALRTLLARLNPGAAIVDAVRGVVPLAAVLNTGRFSFERAAAHPGWLREAPGTHVPETEEYGISSFPFVARRPFHPGRLHALVAGSGLLAPVVRSKGFVWLATRPAAAGVWEHAGRIHRLAPGPAWFAAQHFAVWPRAWREGALRHAWLAEPVGDRANEIVFIGCWTGDAAPARAALQAALQAALLDDAEWAAGPDAWAALPDPWEPWPVAYAGPAPEPLSPAMAAAVNRVVAARRGGAPPAAAAVA
jgi:G3E family GTPase